MSDDPQSPAPRRAPTGPRPGAPARALTREARATLYKLAALILATVLALGLHPRSQASAHCEPAASRDCAADGAAGSAQAGPEQVAE